MRRLASLSVSPPTAWRSAWVSGGQGRRWAGGGVGCGRAGVGAGVLAGLDRLAPGSGVDAGVGSTVGTEVGARTWAGGVGAGRMGCAGWTGETVGTVGCGWELAVGAGTGGARRSSGMLKEWRKD